MTLAGWLLGKLSYRKTCEDKLLRAGHNSRLVEAIRNRRGIVPSEFASEASPFGQDTDKSPYDWKVEDDSFNKSSWSDTQTAGESQSSSSFYSDESTQQSVSYDLLRQQ